MAPGRGQSAGCAQSRRLLAGEIRAYRRVVPWTGSPPISAICWPSRARRPTSSSRTRADTPGIDDSRESYDGQTTGTGLGRSRGIRDRRAGARRCRARAGQDGPQGHRRASVRLSDRRGGHVDGRGAREADRRPPQRRDVPVDAARRREGDDRAGAGRRARHGAHQRRPDGPPGAGAQRLQSALPVPRRRAYGGGDRRADRRRDAAEGDRPPDGRAGRPVLDERRHPQRLQQPASGAHRSRISKASRSG